MKITIFMSALSGGGAERVTCNLANFLSDRGHEVVLLTMGQTAAAEPLREGICYLPLLTNAEKSNRIINNAKRIWRLYRYMKKQAVDAYVVMLPIPTMLMTSFRRLTKAPIIMSERADPKVYSKKTQKRLAKACQRVQGAVFQTAEVQKWYEPHLKGAVACIIPNAINPVFIRPAYEGEREKVIVGAGRLSEQKNFPLLIRAFAKIAPDFPEHKLVIYGKGGLQESYERLAEELGVADRVEFPGFVSDMPERLEKSSMFVLSSD